MSDQQSMSEIAMLRDRAKDDPLIGWAVAELERLRRTVRFAYDIADEELPHAQVGTGAEVALRHIRRKTSDTLNIP